MDDDDDTSQPEEKVSENIVGIQGVGGTRNSNWIYQRDPAVADTVPYKCTVTSQSSFFGRKRTFHLYSQTTNDEDGSTTDVPLMSAEYQSGTFFSRNGVFRVFVCGADNTEGDTVGYISSPGWFADKSIFFGVDKRVKGAVHYQCTSRNGKLMDMETVVPRVHQLQMPELQAVIQQETVLSDDLAGLLCQFVCPLSYWCEDIADMTIKNCQEYAYKNENRILMGRNKKPSWNPAINAFTLEFQGRAQLPSVHNFQLALQSPSFVPSSKDDGTDAPCVLQLGKVEDDKYNMDFGFPLSTFQAFAICISVMQRTFVHD